MKTTTALALALALVLGALPARAEAADPPADRALFRHAPPAEASEGEPLRLAAVVDDAWVESVLVVRYRRARSAEAWREAPFERSSAGGYYATIPAREVRRPGVEYYVVGVAAGGALATHFASEASPHEVRVEPAASLRWIEAERRRLGGRERRIDAKLEAVSFGDYYGADYYLRGELGWTQRLVTWLYSFTLGYGFLAGRTPDRRSNDPAEIVSLEPGYRYGYGAVRLRLHRVVWLDAGALLGFSQLGFNAGGRGELILGKDWRSCVKIGAERLGDLKSNVSITLQWDTVPPFLMAARLVLTDLPGAALTGGSGVDWLVRYPVTDAIAVGASVGWFARNRRPGSFAGGLSASLDF